MKNTLKYEKRKESKAIKVILKSNNLDIGVIKFDIENLKFNFHPYSDIKLSSNDLHSLIKMLELLNIKFV
jgi:hypothetical protein